MIPVNHPSGQSPATLFTIASGYNTAIYQGNLVKLVADGVIECGDGTSDALGVFAGCEYIDANGKPTTSNYWPASTTATKIKAYVYADPFTVFKIGVSANGANFTQAVVGGSVDVANATAGSTTTGRSTASVTATPSAATAQLRVLGFVDNAPYEAVTNTFPELYVQILQHQLVSEPAGV
jgi:hypothetical protein